MLYLRDDLMRKAKTSTCKICGNTDGNKSYYIRERQLNRKESFSYIRCKRCGTLQLTTFPDDIGAYYSDDYYAFEETPSGRSPSKRIKAFAKKYIIDNDFTIPYVLQYLFIQNTGSVFRLYGTKIKPESKILDVGGGNGNWLFRLSKWGFQNLTCVDRFCKESRSGLVRFVSSDITDWDTNEAFDLITMHHSFEHMENPDRVLQRIAGLMKENGLLLIRIPVCGSGGRTCVPEPGRFGAPPREVERADPPLLEASNRL